MNKLTPHSIFSLLIGVSVFIAMMPVNYAVNIRLAPRSLEITKYQVTPSEGQAGQEYDLLITSNNPNCETSNELKDAKLIIPQGAPISPPANATSQAPCKLTAHIKVADNAPVGKLTLWVGKEKESPLGVIEFTVTDNISPGTIPPGMNPAVDVMWSVMPRHIVSDNFGRAIAKEYYAIEIIIGNNSAYTLQLVSVGFELPSDDVLLGLVARNLYNRQVKSDPGNLPQVKTQLDATQKALLKNPLNPKERAPLLPTSSYKITRGTLESKQLTHMRTLILSTITALGPIFTGFTPYFHNVSHRSNFSEAINIFSNPLEKGLELAWPDQRPRQRERFDDQVLRDGLIIRNNNQVRTLAFFPKELLRLPKDVENPKQYDSWKDNAREVRERLGKLVIVGDLIQYVNRISLVPNPPGPVAAPPTAVGISPNHIKQGAKQTFTISGSNFSGAQLIALKAPGIHVGKSDVDPTGHTITAEIQVDDTVEPNVYQLAVAKPDSTVVDIVVLLVDPENLQVPNALVYEQKTPGNKVTVEAKGTYLHNANFRMVATPANTITIDPGMLERSNDGKSLKAVFEVPAGTNPGTYKVEIYDEKTGAKVTKDFVVKAP